MMGSGVAAFLVSAFVLLARGSIAATLTEKVVRRETSVTLTSHGELSRQAPKPKEDVQIASSALASVYTPEYVEKLLSDPVELAKLAEQWCNISYSKGPTTARTLTTFCDAGHSLMQSPSMCIEAAVESGAKTSHFNFMVPSENEQNHPVACFKAPCSATDSSNCFFYNAIEHTIFDADKTTFSGTPVCQRDRWEKSASTATITAAGVHTTCNTAAGYSFVDDEWSCSRAANCGFAPMAYEDRIGNFNASRHLDFVRGCFVNPADNAVYFNAASSMGVPGANAIGTQICNISQRLEW